MCVIVLESMSTEIGRFLNNEYDADDSDVVQPQLPQFLYILAQQETAVLGAAGCMVCAR